MGAREREARDRGVIEERGVPGQVTMAAAAIRTVATLMHVVARMANAALHRSADERLIAMATTAFGTCVRTGQ
jgi:hypothetical protein